MTDKAILIHGTGKRETDRTVSAIISLETGNLTAGISTLDFLDFSVGELLSQALTPGVLDSEVYFGLRGPLQACLGTPTIGRGGSSTRTPAPSYNHPRPSIDPPGLTGWDPI